jgi:imidazolonepropionase
MSKTAIDLVLSGASQVLTCDPTPGDPLGRRMGVGVAIQGEEIAAIAPLPDLEEAYDLSNAQFLELDGKILAPGFVDCHTHLVFGGDARSGIHCAPDSLCPGSGCSWGFRQAFRRQLP